MKALILNSRMGSRMSVLASEHPKCMTEISNRETIVSRHLAEVGIKEVGIKEVGMTTGAFDDILMNYCQSLELSVHITY